MISLRESNNKNDNWRYWRLQQERALREKQRQLEQETNLLSKEFVPLGETKLKRSVNEEVRSAASRAKPVWTGDEIGIWRRESPPFGNKAELCRDERLLDADSNLGRVRNIINGRRRKAVCK